MLFVMCLTTGHRLVKEYIVYIVNFGRIAHTSSYVDLD